MNNISSYRTGNRGMDEKIQRALRRELKEKPFIKNPFNLPQEERHKYGVAPKEDRIYKDGTPFASKGEMKRWDDLLKVEKAGQITNLRRQVPFILQESFISKQPEWGDTPHIEYVADYVYLNISYRKGYENLECVEDFKGGKLTAEYKLKRKLFLYIYAQYPFFESTKEDLSD